MRIIFLILRLYISTVSNEHEASSDSSEPETESLESFDDPSCVPEIDDDIIPETDYEDNENSDQVGFLVPNLIGNFRTIDFVQIDRHTSIRKSSLLFFNQLKYNFFSLLWFDEFNVITVIQFLGV